MRLSYALSIIAGTCVFGSALQAQGARADSQAVASALPPATKLEAFKPKAGTLSTYGFESIGRLGLLSTVEVGLREFRHGDGPVVRGVVVEIFEQELQRKEMSFVDTDEIPELIKAIDALLAIKVNPSSLENFNVQYTTKGELQVTASGNRKPLLGFAIQTGRILRVRENRLIEKDMIKFRTLLQKAHEKLTQVK